MEEFKVFNDAVHGYMRFHPLLVVVADTPQVQRLRNIKQLGVCYFVFPSALHTRFEHSLGTAFIAGKLFDSLKQTGIPPDVNEATWEKRKLCAQIAGLCHDLGHGPFSHTWEEFKRRCGDDWSHEVESITIFDEVLEEKISPSKKFNVGCLETVRDAFTYYGLNQKDIDIIKKMILGEKHERNYLFQVISNKNNNIDVDKWEYITRDSFMLNVPIGFDFHRLLNYCSVVRNENGEEQICFRDKECSVLSEMFSARGKLHDIAYQHTKVKIIEQMLLDALALANDRLKLSATPITELSDHIYQKILYEDYDSDLNMQKAKEILRRIEKRHLYKCLLQESIQSNDPNITQKIKPLLSKISGIETFIDDIAMVSVNVHMTSANKEKPMKSMLIYDKRKRGCQTFDWNTHQNSIVPNLGRLKRKQILLLYKGVEPFPSSLEILVAKKLRKILIDQVLD